VSKSNATVAIKFLLTTEIKISIISLHIISLWKPPTAGDFVPTTGSSAGIIHVAAPSAVGCCSQFQNEKL
jgi:hypothetical protein